MNELDLKLFNIISNVGTARSNYIEAIQAVKNEKPEEAKQLMSEGSKAYSLGHKVHMEFIQKEASGDTVIPTLLLIHAEDLMMSAEVFMLMAEEFMSLYTELSEIKSHLSMRKER